MEPWDYVELVVSITASAVFLGLSVLTAVRGQRESSLALPTALLCADLFAYLGFEILGNLTERDLFEWLEASAASMAGPLLFHLVLTFVGARRSARALQIAVYAYFGGLAIASLAPLVVASWSSFPGGDHWALLMLVGIVPTFSFAIYALARHYWRGGAGEERLRTQLFIATIAVGVGGAGSDLASLAGAPAIPHLAGPGMLVSAILLTALALRARFVSGGLGPSIVTATLIGLLGVLAQLVVFRALGGQTTALVIATLLVLLVVIAAARAVWSSYTEIRERTAHLATLGRLSAQMAHDIRNPLAAIRGAAQYLEEERARGSSFEDQGEFIELILEQTERLDRVVDEYRRLGSAEPKPEPTDVAALVGRVVEGARVTEAASSKAVTITADAERVGTVALDAELVTTALENLVRNALEALESSGGTVVVRARVEGPRLLLSVVDDGPGMDARVLEKAVNDFFTTKAGGSGLGLAFARRVAEAHGGRLTVTSAPGRGTTVALALAM
ncbi:MAG: two-component sensor histidine kinase [Sandaracinaceae bacterium]|nr:two-component sensor histidine kinase [Sandaracinaceae bacterium]